jgi:PAS domain S-box-containing protein
VQSHDDLRVGTVEVLLPLAPVRAAQRETTLALLGGVGLAVLTAALVSWLLAQRITRSIRQLGRAAQQIGAGEFTAPVAVAGPMEIVQLSVAADQMRAQLATTHAALAAETARYLNILESTSDAILLFDQAEQVILINRGAERLLGCQRQTATGARLSQLVRLHGDDTLELERIPLHGACHLAVQQADGRVLTVAASRASIQDDQGNAPGEQIVVLHDVTDAVALGAMKDAFLANVTHEFRTPLAALIASLEILRNEHGDLSPAEQQQMFGALQNGVQRLDTLVQNLLDSASIQAGYFRVQPEMTQLMPLITEALELMEPLVRQRNQRIAVAVPPDVPPVFADDRRLVQVLVNLLSNASKFGPRGDTLQIVVEREEELVAVAVTDHGPGVAESRQGHLFERFLRPGSETVGAQGAGLGLAIVKAVVEGHGGSIVVRSAGEHETTFRFTLPIAAAKPANGDEAYATVAR